MGPKTVGAKRRDTFIRRNLRGATFLTFEHAGHLALIVIIAGLISAGSVMALQMWLGNSMPWLAVPVLQYDIIPSSLNPACALWVAAAMMTLTPAMLILGMRARAEWPKRPGYQARVAYKAPMYIGLAVSSIVTAVSFITLFAVVLRALASIGLSSFDMGGLFMGQFVPPLLVFVVFVAVKWYFFMLIKGYDKSRQFTGMLTIVAGILAAALIISSVVALYQPSAQVYPTTETRHGMYLDRFFKY